MSDLVTVQAAVSRDEQRLIRIAAAKSGKTMSRFARDVLLPAALSVLERDGSFFAENESRKTEIESLET